MRLWALLTALCVAGAADAQQLEFKNTIRSGDLRLSYRWLDHGKREFNTTFTLPRESVRQAEASFRDFSMEGLWQAVMADMQQEIDRQRGGVRVSLRRTSGGVAWNVEARDQATADAVGRQLQARLNASQQAYLARHLRHKVDDRRIMVDFAAATRALQEPLREIAKAFAQDREVGNSERARVAHALAFFQDIPYASLEDANRTGGDFLPAPALLAQNRGDCDSKAAALAAVLRTYVPSRKLAVITMPGHAILAVDLAPEGGERVIRTSGRNMIALEAAGPALYPVGQVAPDTDRLLASRSVEIWPLN